jgi:hypothetical protein
VSAVAKRERQQWKQTSTDFARRSYTHQDVTARRQSFRDAKLLTEEERMSLRYEWGGYGAADIKSPFGAILNAVLRAPPRPAIRYVVAEMERSGGRISLDSLVVTLDEEALATAHETRLAVRAMCGSGQLTKYVQDMPRKDQKGDLVHVPTEMLKLNKTSSREPAPPLTPEERWARADAEVARDWQEIPCKESRCTVHRDPDRISWANLPTSDEPRTTTSRMSGLDRVAIERAYGSSVHPAYANEFGRELAAVLEYVEIVAEYRVKLGTARRNASTAEVLRHVLDDAPTDVHALVAWREARKRFVAATKDQARRLLEGAVASLRRANGQ